VSYPHNVIFIYNYLFRNLQSNFSKPRLIQTKINDTTIPCSRILFEKLIISQLFNKLAASRGTRRSITVFTRPHHWLKSWIRRVQVEAFWVVIPCSVVVGYQRSGGPLHPEDGGSRVLRNIRILPQHYAASRPRRPRLESSQPWKSHIWDESSLNTYTSFLPGPFYYYLSNWSLLHVCRLQYYQCCHLNAFCSWNAMPVLASNPLSIISLVFFLLFSL
jgi:hypothetical protein